MLALIPNLPNLKINVVYNIPLILNFTSSHNKSTVLETVKLATKVQEPTDDWARGLVVDLTGYWSAQFHSEDPANPWDQGKTLFA